MKDAKKSERTAKVGAFTTIITGASVLVPVCQRWPDGVPPFILTLLFSLTLFAFAFDLMTPIARFVRVAATRAFRR